MRGKITSQFETWNRSTNVWNEQPQKPTDNKNPANTPYRRLNILHAPNNNKMITQKPPIKKKKKNQKKSDLQRALEEAQMEIEELGTEVDRHRKKQEGQWVLNEEAWEVEIPKVIFSATLPNLVQEGAVLKGFERVLG